MKNYYDELEVSKTASKEVIEKVYKVLAKKYHPDTTSEIDKQAAEEKFKIISEAYEILSNDEKRKQYDLELEQSNPTISYEDYITIINQRDNLNNAYNELKCELNNIKNGYSGNYNYNYNRTTQSQSNQNFNNYSNYNTNTNKANTHTRPTSKYYNTVTGEPVSAFAYYKYKIKSFLANIGFYLLVLFMLLMAIRSLPYILENFPL